MNIRQKMEIAVTRYDRRQSSRRFHNPYALGLYLQRVDDVVAEIEAGADPVAAISRGFSDGLRDWILKAVS